MDNNGYQAANHEEMLLDTLLFGIKSDEDHRHAFAIGNNQTYQQV